jgi:hypothetical protein
MKVRPKGADLRSLRLTPEEGFVLSRVDGAVSIRELVALTGLEEGRVNEIVGRLSAEGAIEVEGDGGAPAEPPASGVTASSPLAGLGAKARADEEGESGELPPPPPSDETLGPSEDEEPEAAEARQRDEGNYRKIYETVFHPMERDARVAAAKTVEGAELCALCLDPDPQVIHALLSNPRVGFDHARLIAFYHRTHAGLEILGRRNEFLVDAQVQRRLLTNPQLPDAMLRRMVNPKLLMDVYKIAINRENPERTRVKVRELLQKKFMLASSDERAALLVKTEGRCLLLLVNCALDVRTTQILCGKTSYTVLFIQNLARWSATPPALITHILKQPVVRQNMGLRKMLLKHPNCPSEVKRNLS